MLTSEHNNCPLQQSFICHPDLLYFFSCDRQTRSCKDQKSEQRSDPIYSPSVTRLELKFIVNFSKCQKGEESLHTQRRDYKSAASGLQSDQSRCDGKCSFTLHKTFRFVFINMDDYGVTQRIKTMNNYRPKYPALHREIKILERNQQLE